MAPPPPVAISSLFCANASNAISFVTSNVSCATLSASTSISSAGNVIATGGYVPLSALSNSISLASLPGQLLPSAFSNSSIPVSAISGIVGGSSTTSNYVTLTASNIVSAGNVIASNGYVPLSALSNSVSLATLPGQLLSSSFTNNTIPVSALSNVFTSTTMQPLLCYSTSSAITISTGVYYTNIFTTQYNSQGNTGLTYNSGTGFFTNTSGGALILSVSYTVAFLGNIVTTGARTAYMFDGTSYYAVSVTPGSTTDNPQLSSSANIQLANGASLRLILTQTSGGNMQLSANIQITLLNSPTAIVNAAVQSPMHLSLYGAPSTYSSGSSVANTTWSTAGYYYFLFPSSSLSSVNWAPAYTNSTRLQIPVTGLYALKLTFTGVGSTYAGELFMSKNLNNNLDMAAYDDRLLAVEQFNTNNTYEGTISATAYLLSTDFISFGIYLASGASITSFSPRCTATVTLIQNASSIAANVAGNLKLGTVTNAYGYPVDPAGTSGNISAGNVGMFRNRIINGNMAINQRGITSLSLPLNASTYTIDRFASYTAGTGVCAMSSVTLVNTDAPYQYGHRASLKNAITTAYGTTIANYHIPSQVIEGNNIQDLNWGQSFGQPVTVSFWSRTSGVTSLPVSVRNAAATYTYNSNVVVASSGTWQYNTVTIPAPPIGSVGSWDVAGSLHLQGMSVYIGGIQYGAGLLATTTGWVASNSIGTTASTPWITTVGNYVEFTGVQLEKGTIATPFEFRPYAVELGLCQRYYFPYTGILNLSPFVSGNNAQYSSLIPLPSTLRTTATITQLAGTYLATPTTNTPTTTTAITQSAANNAVSFYVPGNNGYSIMYAIIQVNAEL